MNEFTFKNFDELAGFLKGRVIETNSSDLQTIEEILGLLGFRQEKMYHIAIDTDLRMIQVYDDYFQVFYSVESAETVNGHTLIEDYYKLKEDLIYSIIPWPITISEAREMTNLKLSRIKKLAETMLQVVNNLELTEDDMEWLFGRYGLKEASQFLEDLDIQHDNLKFIW